MQVVSPGDCRIALTGVALISLLALAPIGRLARDAGAELGGHKPSA